MAQQNDDKILEILAAIENQPKSKDDLFMQIHDLMLVGNKLGLHDAVDFLIEKYTKQ
jgi:hypothetical protein